jgi:cytochrome c553
LYDWLSFRFCDGCHGKGITGFDYERLAAKHSAMRDELGLKAYKQNGILSPLMTIMKAFLKL